MSRLTSILLILFFSTSFAPVQFKNSSIAVLFGGCFENDMVTLEINKVPVFSNYKVISNTKFGGAANLTITQFSDNLNITFNGQLIQGPTIKINRRITFDFWINGAPYHFEANPRNGEFFYVRYCSPAPGKNRELTVEQKKQPKAPLF